MKLTTKTVIGSVATLMVAGMMASLVNASESYYVGQTPSSRPRVDTRIGQASVLLSDFDAVSPTPTSVPAAPKAEAAETQPIAETKTTETPEPTRAAPIVKYVTRIAPCSENEHPTLVNGKMTGCVSNDESSETTTLSTQRKRPEAVSGSTKPSISPVACEDQGLYTYTAADQGNLYYGSCIPCAMNKFNVQTKTCSR